MKILLTADPEIPVPPRLYGGIERILDALVNGYVARGHEITLLAHGDSKVPCRLIAWKGKYSYGTRNIITNTQQLFFHLLQEKYDLIHSFSRLGYMTPILPMRIPKIMSYQREPTMGQIKKANRLSQKGSLLFTGCSDYISKQIKPFANTVTVYNCVPTDHYDFTPSVDDDAPLSFLGRIEPIKGTHLAIEVAQRTNRKLLIAGNIPAEGEVYFQEKIKPFLNERIQYIGPVDDKQKNILLRQSSAFLMPIQWNEPFGIVMAEAMACGTPVLGFAFGSVPEVVEDSVTGFVCKDLDEMVTRVENIHQISRQKVRIEVEKRFSNEVIVENYLRLYRTMILKDSTQVHSYLSS